MSKPASRTVALLATTLSSLFSIADRAAACRCERPPRPPAEELERMAAVFHGRVASVEEVRPVQIDVTLDVAEIWKGPIERTITVTTATSSAACGYAFTPGSEYLVYASGSEDGNGEPELHVHLCTRTRSWGESGAAHDEELEALGEPIEIFELDPVPFVRGDVNADGRIDIADPVSALSWLFTSGTTPGCHKTIDIDGDGRIEINDPILLLGHLFQGGGTPVAPFPNCGLDEADVSAEIPCRSHSQCDP